MPLTDEEKSAPDGRLGLPGPGPDSGPAPARRPRLLILDLCRLLAALMVVAWHLVANGGGRPPADLPAELVTVALYGWLGVPLFFLISGFVIAMSSWGRTVGEFAVSRIVRLYPAYWVAIALTTLTLVAVPGDRGHRSATDTLVNLSMLQTFLGISDVDRSYWTLAVELQFYVLFAIVVAFGVTYRRTVLFCAIWLTAALTLPFLAPALIGKYAPYFVGGIALYLIYRFGSDLLLWGIVGLSWLLSLASLRTMVVGFLGPQEPLWRSGLVVTGFYLLMIAVAVGWFSWFRWKWAVTAGALTYPLYLLHQEIGFAVLRVARDSMPSWLLVPLVMLGLMALSWLVHRLVEVPAARLLKKGLTGSLRRIRAIDQADEPVANPTRWIPQQRGALAAERASTSPPEAPVERTVAG
jgi:peptidoglycan/LPS O-acetylase OafA/YrhL